MDRIFRSSYLNINHFSSKKWISTISMISKLMVAVTNLIFFLVSMIYRACFHTNERKCLSGKKLLRQQRLPTKSPKLEHYTVESPIMVKSSANRNIFLIKITEILSRKWKTEKSIFLNSTFYSPLLPQSSSAVFLWRQTVRLVPLKQSRWWKCFDRQMSNMHSQMCATNSPRQIFFFDMRLLRTLPSATERAIYHDFNVTQSRKMAEKLQFFTILKNRFHHIRGLDSVRK